MLFTLANGTSIELKSKLWRKSFGAVTAVSNHHLLSPPLDLFYNPLIGEKVR